MITVTREAPDKLTAQEWQFYAEVTPGANELRIRLAGYRHYSDRPTKRHNYRAVKVYDHHSRRDSNIPFAEVPTPQGVADEALDILVKSLVFEWEWK